MIQSTTGLILRIYPLTETSLIVHWLTPDMGRISTVAKGARRLKSPFRGKLDLFYLAEFSFVRSRRSTLHTLREVNLRETFSALRQELHFLQQASYCVALLEQATETDTPIPGMFELLAGLLCQMPRMQERVPILAFELKLLNELGQTPNVPASQLTAGAKQIIPKLTNADWSAWSRLRLGAEQTCEIEQFLSRFLLHHLGRIPRGRRTAIHRNTSESEK